MIVLAVIHDLNLAARYCNTGILINKGKIFSAGTLDIVLTSENIKSVFKVDAIVRKSLVTNSLYVIPLSIQKPSPTRNCAIHIIGGAGTGTAIMKALVDEGYDVTAGVLNMLDTDYETAELLKIPSVTEAPFSPITEQTKQANLDMVKKAAIVVMTSVPFGYGNLQNLEAAIEAAKLGIKTYVIDEVPIESRDFTGGKATALLAELKHSGAIFVKHPAELPTLVNRSHDKMELAKHALTDIPGHTKKDSKTISGSIQAQKEHL
jgi:iron complex transport system ATP-binding protein